MKLTLASALIALAALIGTASPAMADTITVDGVDYPLCSVEDCSDQPGQFGAWFSKSTGHWILESGDEWFDVTVKAKWDEDGPEAAMQYLANNLTQPVGSSR